MSEETEYKLLYGSESWGEHGMIGVRIMIMASKLKIEEIGDSDNEGSTKIRYAAADACEAVREELIAKIISNDPLAKMSASVIKGEILSCFAQPIFIEEIPNGYCSKSCCRHLPWFVVTTPAGRFKIGWRKRVISIEWEDKRIKTEELFSGEDVTKWENGIHAWSVEKARAYVHAVVSNVLLLNEKEGK